jgi:hypothetical protein
MVIKINNNKNRSNNNSNNNSNEFFNYLRAGMDSEWPITESAR